MRLCFKHFLACRFLKFFLAKSKLTEKIAPNQPALNFLQEDFGLCVIGIGWGKPLRQDFYAVNPRRAQHLVKNNYFWNDDKGFKAKLSLR